MNNKEYQEFVEQEKKEPKGKEIINLPPSARMGAALETYGASSYQRRKASTRSGGTRAREFQGGKLP